MILLPQKVLMLNQLLAWMDGRYSLTPPSYLVNSHACEGVNSNQCLDVSNCNLGHTKRNLWFTDFLGQKLERASDISKILFLKKKKKIRMVKILERAKKFIKKILKSVICEAVLRRAKFFCWLAAVLLLVKFYLGQR